MTRGDEEIETRSLKFQQPASLPVQFFRAPPLPVGFEVYKFSEPPSQLNNFFRAPLLGVSTFSEPPSISSSPPPTLVILNELSLECSLPLYFYSALLFVAHCNLLHHIDMSGDQPTLHVSFSSLVSCVRGGQATENCYTSRHLYSTSVFRTVQLTNSWSIT